MRIFRRITLSNEILCGNAGVENAGCGQPEHRPFGRLVDKYNTAISLGEAMRNGAEPNAKRSSTRSVMSSASRITPRTSRKAAPG